MRSLPRIPAARRRGLAWLAAGLLAGCAPTPPASPLPAGAPAPAAPPASTPATEVNADAATTAAESQIGSPPAATDPHPAPKGPLASEASPAVEPSPAAEAKPAPDGGLREAFPHVWIDPARRLVEFAGSVPIDVHNPQTPDIYLEVFVCSPDSKEHEALVVTPARPAHIHAALLAVGLRPGAPGRWAWQDEILTPIAPTGDELEVFFLVDRPGAIDLEPKEEPAATWVTSTSGQGLGEAAWRFAGSRIVRRGPAGTEVYDADGTGVIIGLHTFGSEVVAWPKVMSPDSAVLEPEWIANRQRVPKFGTPVRVRIRPSGAGVP